MAHFRLYLPGRMAYTCRGCGTQITTPNSFQKCPVCGIRIN